MDYSLSELYTTIAENLGMGRVELELNQAHYKRAVDATMKALARYYPQYNYQVIPIQKGGLKYLVNARNCIGIKAASFFCSGPRFEEAPYYTRWVDRTMELMDMKDTQRVFGDTPEWSWKYELDQQTNKQAVYFYCTITMSSFVDTFARIPDIACIWYAWALEASEDPEVGIPAVPYDLRSWVEDYATARARMILGDVRGKFGGVPGAEDGSVLPNDGGRQVQRAEAKIQELEADLRGRQRQTPLIFD